MIYVKSSRTVKPTRKRLAVSSFEGINRSVHESLLPFKYSPLSYNFRFGNGALTGGGGFSELTLPMLLDPSVKHYPPELPAGIRRIWLYRRYDTAGECRDDRLIFLLENGSFYYTAYWEPDTLHALTGISVLGRVSAVNYRLDGEDVFLISSEYGSLWLYDGVNSPEEIESAPAITSMCIHYERLFATTGGESNKVWFSDDFNPLNWNVSMTEGGFIELVDDAGRANRVISFLDHVYIFRDYGINRLTAYGDQSEFTLTKLFVSTGRIFADTVAVYGDKVIFLAEDGLYAFDGTGAARILDGITPMISSGEYAAACFFNCRYYLAVRCDYGDGRSILAENEPLYRNNTLLEYDVNLDTINLMRGIDIAGMLPVNLEASSKLIACFNKLATDAAGELSSGGSFMEEPMPKYWSTAETDLGVYGRKCIRDITIKTLYDVKLGIIADGKEHVYAVRGAYSTARIRIDIAAERFSFFIKSSSAEADISSFSVTVDVY